MQKCDVNSLSVEQTKLKIQLLMTKARVTQKELAEIIGMDVATLNKKINGISLWKLTECVAVANFFGVSLSEIFLGKELQESI